MTPRRTSSRPLRGLAIAATATGLALAAGACSSSPSTSTSSGGAGTTAAAPGSTGGSDYQIVSDATVATGLADVRSRAAAIKATLTTSQDQAKKLVTEMYDKWFAFEGTIRQNDKNLYLQMEDGLAAIKAGVQQNDPAKVDKGIADLEAGASGYLAQHP